MTHRPETMSPEVDATRLWAGGGATAAVVALAAVVGILATRGLAHVSILAPAGAGTWGNANTAAYASGAAGCALAATGLMHLLLVSTPRAVTFFRWIMVLCTLIAVVLPLSLMVEWPSRIATAIVNFALGVCVALLLPGVALSTVRTEPTALPTADL
jgi:hypothetical protein